MENLHIAICEDSQPDCEQLRRQIERCCRHCRIETFASGEEFLESHPAGRFQLVFMDVYFSGISGVAAAGKLREADPDVQLVFTTSSEDFALEGFRVGALQYLVKPIDPKALAAAVAECRIRLKGRKPPAISLPVNGQAREVPLRDILYAEVYNRLCTLHLTGGDLQVQMSLDELALLLPAPDFYRCHRSYVVNFAHVGDLSRDFTMKNGDMVYVGRNGLAKCEKAYMEYLMDRAGRDGP